jgi:hypothetical protein
MKIAPRAVLEGWREKGLHAYCQFHRDGAHRAFRQGRLFAALTHRRAVWRAQRLLRLRHSLQARHWSHARRALFRGQFRKACSHARAARRVARRTSQEQEE